MHEKGEPLERALVDAGIMRLRPVMITLGATVLALFPLALHGGPLWEPLCYSQISGLVVATFITLLLVPVLYSILVLDLKFVKWEGPSKSDKEKTARGTRGLSACLQFLRPDLGVSVRDVCLAVLVPNKSNCALHRSRSTRLGRVHRRRLVRSGIQRWQGNHPLRQAVLLWS